VVEVGGDDGDPGVVAAQADADVARARLVAHVVVVPQDLDVPAVLAEHWWPKRERRHGVVGAALRAAAKPSKSTG
jgi:hypothetical protein